MSDEINMTISIPTDADGYVLLRCEHCGTYFKGTPSDLKDDGVLHIFCPLRKWLRSMIVPLWIMKCLMAESRRGIR